MYVCVYIYIYIHMCSITHVDDMYLFHLEPDPGFLFLLCKCCTVMVCVHLLYLVTNMLLRASVSIIIIMHIIVTMITVVITVLTLIYYSMYVCMYVYIYIYI